MPNAWQNTAEWLDAAVERHHAYRRWTLNLIASENVMSPDVARYYDLELGHRYGNYRGLDPDDRTYRGNRHLLELEARALADARDLFHAGAADLRPLSGHVAGAAAIMGLCRPGDLVLELDRSSGGHLLAEKLCRARLLRLRIEPLPFDAAELDVDVPAAVRAIREKRPRLVIVGSSSCLFPTPLADLSAACRGAGTTLLVDASHVLGLVAGGVFPQPMDEGADLVASSTHKTLAGPQGGLLLGRTPRDLEEMVPALFPGLVTNHHLARIPAMVALFSEWRTYGADYARAIVANALALADALDAAGVPVLRTSRGATRSHTLLLRDADPEGAARRLEAGGIILGTMSVPKLHGGACLRLGVQEITRLGLKPDRAGELARLLRDALAATDPDSLVPRVRAFTADLRSVHFCHGHAHGNVPRA